MGGRWASCQKGFVMKTIITFPRMLVVLLSFLFVSCIDYSTTCKVLIVNNRDFDFIAQSYKNNIPIDRNLENINTSINFNNNNQFGITITRNSIILFEDVRDFGPSIPYNPWDYYDKIVLSAGPLSEEITITKKDAQLYKKSDRDFIYLIIL